MSAVEVPQTYFLEDAAALARASILARLDPTLDYQPFFRLDLSGDVPTAHHASWDYCDMAGRFVDALILTAPMTPSPAVGEGEHRLRAFLLGRANPADGLFYDAEAPWSRYAADMFCQGRVLLGLVSWFLLTGESAVQQRIEALIAGLSRIATWQGETCWYLKDIWIDGQWEDGGLWNGAAPGYAAQQLVGIVRYARATGSAAALRLARGLARHFVARSGIAADGSFQGHTHSQGILPSTLGVLAYALLDGDEALAGWSRGVYEYARGQSSRFGWVPDGMALDPAVTPFARTCETCALTDMLELAITLTEAGLGDYWDDVERFARNQLLEQQVTDLTRAIPPAVLDRTAPAVKEMLHGAFDSSALPNALFGGPHGVVEGCCTPAGARACFLVWDRVMTRRPDGVFVNLTFSRDAPSARLLSEEPYRGRLQLMIEEAATFYLRVPEWADREEVRLTADGVEQPLDWRGRYLSLGRAQPGQTFVLTYPQRAREVSETLAGETYVTRWRGGTVTGINPRGAGYRLYDRTGFETETPPQGLHQLSTQPVVVRW